MKIARAFTKTPAGSVLWQQGQTIVWCTASVAREVPPWFAAERPGGWVTAEYVMMPASTPQRKAWPKIGHTDARGTEIQRLIGRCLRAVLDLRKIGPHTIAVDCQVLQADGGTRTAAICAAYVALADCLARFADQVPQAPPGLARSPRYDPALYEPKAALSDPLAAVSVGIVDGEVRLDLDYQDDARAEVDMNVALAGGGKLVEVQAAAENGGGFAHAKFLELLDLATAGCTQLMALQRQSLAIA